MNRRNFIKQTGFAAGGILTSSLAAASIPMQYPLTILHTNDVHSRLEPFPMDGSRNQGLGGVAPRAALIAAIRAQAEQVLLLDAGDIFQGTPYFNIYKGEPEIKAMSKMRYDAATIGNHDFDAGIENLANQLKYANFPMVNCNYDFTGTPLENIVKPYITLQKGKQKIGILGVGIELEGLVPENLYGKTVYKDPIRCANEAALLLRKQGCDLVICLSHLGDKYDDGKVSDEVLAKETDYVDLINGGHTHRFFEQPRKYRNKLGGDVLVNQVGFGGIQMGRLDYIFSGNNRKKTMQAHTVVVVRKTSE